MLITEEMKSEWESVMVSEHVPAVADKETYDYTVLMLENSRQEMVTEGATTANVTGYDAMMLAMVRRAAPVLVSNRLVGVQPMKGPSSMIFAMKAHYTGNAATGAEALHDTINKNFAPKTPTATAEALGVDNVANPWPEMSFSVEKKTVTAESRALKATLSREVIQDMKALHGEDAIRLLSGILATEVVAEINRELVDYINTQAVTGGVWDPLLNAGAGGFSGTYDLAVDADGRWAVERYKALLIQIQKESYAIALATRRGLGNVIICSPNVAGALEMASKIDNSMVTQNLQFNNTTSFVGVLAGRFEVHVDPFAAADYITVGYKGANAWDAGVYYCPYAPMTHMQATDGDSFEPRLGVKSRYGLTTNPFVAGTAGTNVYYRTFTITNI